MKTKSFWLAWDKHLTLSSCKWLSSWTCHLTLSCCKCVGCWTCSLLPHEKGQHHVAQPAGEDASDWSLSYSCDWYIDKLELGEHIRLQTHLAQRHSTTLPTTKLHLHEGQEDHKRTQHCESHNQLTQRHSRKLLTQSCIFMWEQNNSSTWYI